MKPSTEGVAMTGNRRKTKPQPSTGFRKTVTGGSRMQKALGLLLGVLVAGSMLTQGSPALANTPPPVTNVVV